MRAYHKFIRICIIVLCALALALVIVSGINNTGEAPIGAVERLSADWMLGEGERAQLPLIPGADASIYRALPDKLPDEAVLYVQTNYQRVRAYLNSAELAVRGMPESTLFAMANDCPWTAITLPADAAGKTLELSFSGYGSKKRAEVYSALMGRESDIRFTLLSGALPKLITCACVALMAALLGAYAVFTALRGASPSFRRLMQLCAFSALAAVWMITDTDLQGVMYVGSESFFLANLFSYMLMPLPFLMLVRDSSGRNRRAVDISVGLVLVEVIMNGVWMALGLYRLYWTLTATHVVLMLAVGFALFQCVLDNLRAKSASSIETLLSLCVLSATGLGAIIQFYTVANADNTLLFRYGILIFVVVLGVDAVRSGAALIARARSFEQLRVREEEYRIAAEHSGKLILRYDIITREAYLQPNAAEELMLSEKLSNVPEAILKTDVVAPESEREFARVFDEMRAGNAQGSCVARLMRAGAGPRWYHADYTTIYSASGAPIQAIMSLYDVTDMREKEMAYEKWRQNYNMLKRDKINYYEYNLTKDTFDREEGDMLPHVDPSVSRTLSAMALYTATHYAYPDDRAKLMEFYARDRLLERYYDGAHADEMVWRRMDASGAPLWTRASVELIPDPYSSDVKGFILLQDIDAQKKAELLADDMRTRDSLTALYNRGAFIERVNALFSQAPPEACHVLIMIDIDGFKQINDTYGHSMGDMALKRVAAQLSALPDSNQLAGRIGGDEFIVCLQNVERDAIEARVNALCEALKSEDENHMRISGSIGAAIFPRDGRTFEELYPLADTALYTAKHQGKSRYAIYQVSE